MAAYVFWGVFPLFWVLLDRAAPLEVLAQRILWSVVVTAIALLVTGQGWRWLRPSLAGGQWRALALASVVITVNWGMFIFAVNTGHVVESSLGYFINPLVNLVLGWWLFGERLDRWGRTGALLALVGVIVISARSWHTVWISLLLAGSFGAYGAIKKKASIPALRGLFVESSFMAPLCLVYVVGLQVAGASHFGEPRLTALFAVSGVITAIPLFLFAVAARGLPLGTLGVLQYVAPTMQFLIGVFVTHQRIDPIWWVGLPIVWLGCIVYLIGLFRQRRRLPVAPSVVRADGCAVRPWGSVQSRCALRESRCG